MNKNRIRLTESQLHRVIKESVGKVLRESVVRAQFNNGVDAMAGSFEAALDKAWRAASPGNKAKLEEAFPEFFNKSAMYGSEDEPFDFRDFPTKDSYDKHYADWKTRH